MSRASEQYRRAVLSLIALAIGGSLVGCSVLFEDTTPGNPVGTWVSEEAGAIMRLDETGVGSFTMCKPNFTRIEFTADSWPGTIPVVWEEHDETGGTLRQLWLMQDWTEYQRTGVGFSTVNKILFWRNGVLEMGAEFPVIFKKSDDLARC